MELGEGYDLRYREGAPNPNPNPNPNWLRLEV